LTSLPAVRARSVALVRAVLGALVVLSGVAVLHACVIEERPFDAQLGACTDYCREIAGRCTGDSAVYENDEQCLAVCAQLPLGSAEDPPGENTLLCRLDQLYAGGFEATSRCPAAGPGGNGACGDDCESFCALRRQACSEEQPSELDIARENFCERSCPGLARAPGPSIQVNAFSDTLECRMIQLARAFADPATALASCRESQITPRNPESLCSDDGSLDIERDRRTYCKMVMTSCTGEYQVYDSEDQCVAISRTFERGQNGDMLPNTLRCRRYHAYAALDRPFEHCAHAGPTGDGHCADAPNQGTGNCVSYCRILERACNDEYVARFSVPDADPQSCLSTCSGLPDALRDGFTAEPRYTTTTVPEPGTLKCRTLHAVRAMSAPDDECAAAFADPGSECE
jgi:hypothetical protein